MFTPNGFLFYFLSTVYFASSCVGGIYTVLFPDMWSASLSVAECWREMYGNFHLSASAPGSFLHFFLCMSGVVVNYMNYLPVKWPFYVLDTRKYKIRTLAPGITQSLRATVQHSPKYADTNYTTSFTLCLAALVACERSRHVALIRCNTRSTLHQFHTLL